ncbi:MULTISPECIES: hypothetical protein [Pseudomonas]|uniref:Uncharacterized protein n=1 Tax=Pseudomonas juntendi TaxID=2666183 RepID=A0A7W2LYG8_9PSED|nr:MULTISPECIES: hypothetical protein [Pseudomonas]MBA6134014.1 hypothetical protein [Pseudomonas juntendi]MBA6149377.1 hypothetical protein [Pseudomonas juntendi]HCT4466757.1 hypothetical protein [Pseudomonas aeruginosa]
MKNLKAIIAIAAIFSMSVANADYVVKVNVDKSSINFKQYYDNVGANPDDNNMTSKDPACTVTQADLDVFNGKLIRVFDEDGGLSCVIDYAVPAATFAPDCVGNEQATTQGLAFTNAMIAKGVKGFASFAYFGECK